VRFSSKAVRHDINALAAGPSATVRLRIDVRNRAHRQARPCGCGLDQDHTGSRSGPRWGNLGIRGH
jgi:hypothetical protein